MMNKNTFPKYKTVFHSRIKTNPMTSNEPKKLIKIHYTATPNASRPNYKIINDDTIIKPANVHTSIQSILYMSITHKLTNTPHEKTVDKSKGIISLKMRATYVFSTLPLVVVVPIIHSIN
jgi:hypothetical protein